MSFVRNLNPCFPIPTIFPLIFETWWGHRKDQLTMNTMEKEFSSLEEKYKSFSSGGFNLKQVSIEFSSVHILKSFYFMAS